MKIKTKVFDPIKMNKTLQNLLIVLLFVLIFSNSVFAITGSIGNAKMILSVDVGDTVERSILVKNVNNVSVNVSVSATGDLEKEIIILDKEFALESGDEKKAWFKVKLNKEGTYNNKINVKFIPSDINGSGVGLASNVIIKVGDTIADSEDDEAVEDIDDNENKTSLILISGKAIAEKFKNINILYASAGLLTFILVIVFIWLVAAYNKIQNKAKAGAIDNQKTDNKGVNENLNKKRAVTK